MSVRYSSQNTMLNALEFKMCLWVTACHQRNQITFSFTTRTQQLSTSPNIHALPNKAIFCTCSIFSIIPISFTNFSNLVDTVPNAPTTTGITDTFLMSQRLVVLSFKGLYFLLFQVLFQGL